MALEAVHLIPSREKIYMRLLLNVSIMGMWEIKLQHQSNAFSTGVILNDKHIITL